MASGVPADILGLQDRYGRIEVGRPASLTCLDESLATQAVLVDGEMSGGEGGDTGA
jgi:N-acetylglucosamine-6-phosphate deacetylase